MAAPKGNNYNKKWKTKEERQAAFKAVCEHLASGLSKACLPMCDWDTVEAYMDNHPDDFPADKLREAMRRQMLVWEKIGLEGTMGGIKGFKYAAPVPPAQLLPLTETVPLSFSVTFAPHQLPTLVETLPGVVFISS